MKVLVFGSSGFIGRSVCAVLAADHEVHTTSRSETSGHNNHTVDLLDGASVEKLISNVMPDVIINCAGIVGGTGDVSQSQVFTRNILQAVVGSNLKPKQIIISGSAAVYGFISAGDLPVGESLPRKAKSEYGLAKMAEEDTALEYRSKYGLPVVVARIFNPVGRGMLPVFITSRIAQQIADIKAGKQSEIELSRLDAERDYIAVKDVAQAIKHLAEATDLKTIYNVGSGRAVSNGYIAEKMAKYSGLDDKVKITETRDQAEPIVASQANISMIQKDTGWSPQESIDETLREIVDAK